MGKAAAWVETREGGVLMDDRTRQLLTMGVIGLVAGWLASVVMGGSGLIRYLVIGVIGSFVGGYLLRAVGVDLGIRNKIAREIATATIGAIVVVILARIIA
jgi:uncharacterized membrane protein YeaQ/YmgE (transglycosylase-associated protein family)